MKKYVFRGLFCDERDEEITKIIWTYFAAVEERWPLAWEDSTNGLMLNRTNGVKAFMKFFGIAYKTTTAKIGENVPLSKYSELFKRVTLKDTDFNTDNFKPGAGGEGALVRRLYSDTELSRG